MYIAPLKGTPFSIAMVLPTEYGHAWLKVASDEFKKYRQAGQATASPLRALRVLSRH